MSDQDRRTFLHQLAGSMAAMVIAPEVLPVPPRLAGRPPLRLGVVGAGRWGVRILTELAKFEAAQVVAACDVQESGVRRGLRRAQGATGYANHAEMLEKQEGLDAVIVAAPTHLHRQIVSDCLEAGKHVWCAGPLASSVEDLQAIVAASRAASTVFQAGHLFRSNPVYELARSFVRSGNIRDLVQLRASSHQRTAWQDASNRAGAWKLFRDTSSGLPGELLSHQIDTVAWFTGKYPQRVQGSGSILMWNDGREIPDTVNCLLDYGQGLQMSFEGTLANSFDGTNEVFLGTMGTIKMAETHGWMVKEAEAPTQGWEVYAAREKIYKEEGIILIADATKLAKLGKLKEGIGLPHPPVYYSLESFLKSVLEEKPVDCTAEDGLRAALVGIRAHEAVMSGETREIEAELLQAS